MVCNSEFSGLDDFTVCYHRGLEWSSLQYGNKIYVNDVLIYRNGNRILRVTIDESTYYINIYLLTLPEISIHKDINEIIRNVGFNNLFWLSGCNYDFETWKHKIEEWDNDFFKNTITTKIIQAPIKEPNGIYPSLIILNINKQLFNIVFSKNTLYSRNIK